MRQNIYDWFSKASKEIKNLGDVRDIHIDEFPDIKLNSPEDYLMNSCTILKELSLVAKDFNLSGLRLDLNIELKESDEKKGRPIDLRSIIEDVDTYSIPEILLYKPIPDNNLSVGTMELYRTPILFKICDGIEDFKVFYEEYRSYTDIDEEESFSRWLNFVYVS